MRKLLITLSLLFPLTTFASPLEDGLTAFREGNYPKAFNIWKPLAEAGNADAQYNVGLLYMNGLGVAKNSRIARTLFMAAAKQGQADAQYNLGLMYYQGTSVFRSNKDAVNWWKKAAAQNHAAAQFNLGIMYAYGIWVGKDINKTLELWQSSATQGYKDAVKALIRVYENGEFGLEPDPQKAAYWKKQISG
jgi:uncharacterized protein